MQNTTTLNPPNRTVRYIPATINVREMIRSTYRQLRVAAYCRVSTKQDEQINSYENQKKIYTDRINSEPNWTLVEIFADKGITGTSTKKRDDFNRMIRYCKQGKIDMIITKSVSRFARNTVDCLKYIRMLKKMNVDVYFEEQGIHSLDNGAEFYITIYGCIAQSESENMSSNIIIGQTQSHKDGKAAFHCKRLLGYTRSETGQIEIVPEQAEIVKRIYDRFLSGESIETIAESLTAEGIETPMGKTVWSKSVIASILTNEKYKGDILTNKTYVTDPISKVTKINNGERPQHYIENHHPAIIDSATFGRVQEEMARRNGKRKIKQVGTKTEQGKYSSKYALTELLVCGECKTPYRRCTWTVGDKKKIVWRCINRLDYGKKLCHTSPTIEESVLQDAIMSAIMKTAKQNIEVLTTLKTHIAMGLEISDTEDEAMEMQIRIAEIDAEFKTMLQGVAADTIESFDEEKATRLMTEKTELQNRLNQITESKQKRENAKSRLDEIFTILDGLENHPMTYDDQIVRQLLECVVVESKTQIKIIFIGGLEINQTLG